METKSMPHTKQFEVSPLLRMQQDGFKLEMVFMELHVRFMNLDPGNVQCIEAY